MLIRHFAVQAIGKLTSRAHQFVERLTFRFRPRQHGKQVQARETLRIHDRGIERTGLSKRCSAQHHAPFMIGQVENIEWPMPEAGPAERLTQGATWNRGSLFGITRRVTMRRSLSFGQASTS